MKSEAKPPLAGATGSARHQLKTWPAYFDAVWSKRKRFEIRKNDRNYQVGDELVLREYDPETDRYLGREVVARVTYRLPGGRLGIDPDYCVMSLKVLAYKCRKSPNAPASATGEKIEGGNHE